jgi:DNA-binding NarL/FixJ family response regulator
MNNQKVGVIITDDHKLFRKGVAALISDFDFVEVLGEAENGLELLDILEKNNKDQIVVLLDLRMPEMDGPEVFGIIKNKYPEIKVIILSMEDDHQIISHLIKEGVNGYLLKSADPDEMETALRKVIRNDFYFSDSITEIIMKELLNYSNEPITTEINLTPRELDVLKLICEELTAGEIADQLCLSVRTVEGYRTKLLSKTNTKNMAGLVLYAVKNKIIEI